jgi:hypothetical protein
VPTEEDAKGPLILYARYETAWLRRVVQKRAAPQRRIPLDRLSQSLSDRSGIQAEELGQFPHSFAMRQTYLDGASIGRDSHESDPFHVLLTYRRDDSRPSTFSGSQLLVL